jgi:oligoendopeptidase F
MRNAKAHLRTRVGKDGMDYKGFNIAVHEMGHNVEQVLSLNDMDHWLLRGVPNTAFTEAMAFVFQARDLSLLGLETQATGGEAEAFKTLHDFWGACEIAAVALVDMETWRWMYAHPDATPAQLNEAVVGISKKVWNQYYAPVMGQKDVVLLGIYSHIIHSWLYLPDYPIGHLIAFQVEEQMKKAGAVGTECERMVATGNIAPDLWMEKATGSRVGADALLAAARRSLSEL